jgi:CheY-like chemotaxis protein
MKKVFVVEDDRKIAIALSTRLKAQGHACQCAYDAVTAIGAAARFEPDAIILDLMMPGGGGFTVLERLRNLPQTGGVPFIIITAAKDPKFRRQAEEHGVFAFFEKPYDAQALMTAVDEAVGVQDPIG